MRLGSFLLPPPPRRTKKGGRSLLLRQEVRVTWARASLDRTNSVSCYRRASWEILGRSRDHSPAADSSPTPALKRVVWLGHFATSRSTSRVGRGRPSVFLRQPAPSCSRSCLTRLAAHQQQEQHQQYSQLEQRRPRQLSTRAQAQHSLHAHSFTQSLSLSLTQPGTQGHNRGETLARVWGGD